MVKVIGLKMEEKRWQSALWFIINPSKYNTQNRGDHCARHTNTMSYYKQILHFVKYASTLSKMVSEDSQSWAGGNLFFFFFLFQRPSSLKTGQPSNNFQMVDMLGILRINSAEY